MPYRFSDLEDNYTELIAAMKIKSTWLNIFDRDAKKIIKYKKVYQSISKRVNNVPWQVIGIIHMLESGQDFRTHLHNGDSLQYRTHNVPAGRPLKGSPPFKFEDSAVDSLVMSGFDKVQDWTEERICYQFEKYNGFGYRNKGVNSPYLWSGTTNYVSGKYVSDGVFNSGAVSRQAGAMGILARIRALDSSTEEVVAASRKLTYMRALRNTVAATVGSYMTADNLSMVPDWAVKMNTLAKDHSVLAIMTVVFVLWIFLKFIENMSITDYNEGRYVPSGMAPAATPVAVTAAPTETDKPFVPGSAAQARSAATADAGDVSDSFTPPSKADDVPTVGAA